MIKLRQEYQQNPDILKTKVKTILQLILQKVMLKKILALNLTKQLFWKNLLVKQNFSGPPYYNINYTMKIKNYQFSSYLYFVDNVNFI